MATYYIAPTGDDTTGDGSEGNPWLNLFHALDEMDQSDTVIVKQGIYLNQSTTISTVGQRLFSKKIIGESQNAKDTILDFDGEVFQLVGTLAGSDDVSTFQDITLRNIRNIAHSQGLFSSSVGTYNFLRVRFVDVRTGGSTNSSSPSGGFFSVNSGTVNIEGCTFEKCYARSEAFYYPIVTFSSNADGTFNMKNCSVFVSDESAPSGSTNIQNIARLPTGGSSGTVNINNCILYNKSGENPIIMQSVNTGVVVNVTNSCINGYSSATNSDNEPVAVYNPVTDNVINQDPLFVDPDNGFFEPAANSPVRGLGSV